MKYLKSFYKTTLLLSLIAISLASCKDDEIVPNITIESNNNNKIWELNPIGDTISIKYTSNLSSNKIQVMNPLTWVDYQLSNNQLKIFVKANNDIGKRIGNISLIGVEKGTLLSNNIIKLSQNSDKQLAESKYLYTHFLKLKPAIQEDAFHNENRAYKVVVPELGGETVFNNIFVTNINKNDIEIISEYNEENSQDWIIKSELIITEKGIEGIRINTKKLPENIYQRSVKIMLRDKKFNTINASIVCSQFKEVVQLINPEDYIINIPSMPTNISLPIKTKLNIDQIEFKIITVQKVNYSDEIDQDTFDKRVYDPIFQYNYMNDVNPNTEAQKHYHLEETNQGLVLKGLTSTHSKYKGVYSYYKGPYKKFIQITNTVNDQKLFIAINQDNSENSKYILFEDGTKEKNINIPTEGGIIPIPKIKSNQVTEHLFIQYPEWTVIPNEYKPWKLPINLSYPDNIEIQQDIKLLPNTYREEKLGTIFMSFTDFMSNVVGASDTNNGRPLKINIKQSGFSGAYIFEPKSNINNEILIDNSQAGTPVGFNTNLDKKQIQISKTAKSGWIDYQIITNNKTGYVTSILFIADENSTNEDRSVTLTIKGPKGEGLPEYQIKFKQSK